MQSLLPLLLQHVAVVLPMSPHPFHLAVAKPQQLLQFAADHVSVVKSFAVQFQTCVHAALLAAAISLNSPSAAFDFFWSS